MAKKVRKIITRKNPNLECGFFAGLLEYLERSRVGLGITRGEISWEFVSTVTEAIVVDDETICFNVGGGQFDQHGHPQNKSLCELCSIDLVHKEYPFTERRPWLREVYQLVRDNDVFGRRISRHPFNLREIINGLGIVKSDNPQLVLDWSVLAFCGVFENLKNGRVKKVFDPAVLVEGVRAYDPDRVGWFEDLLQLGIGAIKNQTRWAQKAVAKAEELGKTAEVYVPAIDANVRVIQVMCDSVKTAPVARSRGYHVVIQHNRNGHCQIHGGNVKVGETKKWLDMSAVARELHFLEAKFIGKRIARDQNWSASGSILFEDGTKVPWYLPEFLTSVYNGTLSSRDVEPTRIRPARLLRLVIETLSQCQMIVQEGDGAREKVDSEAGELNFDVEDIKF